MIGQRAWVFDQNRTVYRRDKPGGGPIWREHWRPAVVCAETRLFWLIGHNVDAAVTVKSCLAKIPKKGPLPANVALDEETIERRAFVIENRAPVDELIRWLEDKGNHPDYETLRKVAHLLRYDELDPAS